jgi:CheY-like chemotaxis protein
MTVQAETQLTDLQRTPLRVMIVDDAASTRRFLTAVIQSAAVFDLLDEFGNGHDAIEAAQTLQPDVVLLDLLLPDMNGSQVLEEIRRVAQDTRVVILSNNAKRAEPALAGAGAVGFIEKGIAPDDLLYQLSRILQVPIEAELPATTPDVFPRCAVIFDADALTRFQMSCVLRNCGFQVVSEVADVTDAGAHMQAFVCSTRPAIVIFGSGCVAPQILAQIRRESPCTLLVAYTTQAVPLSVAGTDTFRLVVPPDMEGLGQSVRELVANAYPTSFGYELGEGSRSWEAPLGSYLSAAYAFD